MISAYNIDGNRDSAQKFYGGERVTLRSRTTEYLSTTEKLIAQVFEITPRSPDRRSPDSTSSLVTEDGFKFDIYFIIYRDCGGFGGCGGFHSRSDSISPFTTWSSTHSLRRESNANPKPETMAQNGGVGERIWYSVLISGLMLGPIYTLWMGRQPTMVISSAKVAVDLLEKRSGIYSSRPRFVVMGEMYLNNDSTLVMPYGEKWRKHRKLLHSGLMQKAAHSYRPLQEIESSRLVWDLVEKPEKFLEAIERYTASVTLMLAFGRRVDSLGDPLVNRVVERNRFMASINVYVPVAIILIVAPAAILLNPSRS